MSHVRTALALAAAVLGTGCSTSTCDCLAPMGIVFGNVTGTAAPVSVELRTADGDCSDGAVPSGIAGAATKNDRGEYELAFHLQRAGPLCLVVAARTLDQPPISVTRRVPVTVPALDATNQPRFRVDLAFSAP